MALLTSTPSCGECAGLSQKVADLEHRISILFKIHVEKDSEVIVGKTRTSPTSAQLADTVCSSGNKPDRRSTCPQQPGPGAISAGENHWLQIGAKPKGPRSSTPRKSEKWSIVPASKALCKSGPHHTKGITLENRFNILNDEDFPPLSAPHFTAQLGLTQSGTPPPGLWTRSGPPASARRRGSAHYTPAPGYNKDRPPLPLGTLLESGFPDMGCLYPSCECAAQTQPGDRGASSRTSSPSTRDGPGGSTASPSRTSGPSARGEQGASSASSPRTPCHSVRGVRGGASAAPPGPAPGRGARCGSGRSAGDAGRTRSGAHASLRPNPSVLVLGTSMVRHVKVINGHTSCHPGALVQDINNSAPSIIHNLPSVSTVVIHAGTNDLKFQQSEKLNQDFISLINTIKNNNKTCIISGPFSAPRFGDVKYSRARLLHLFLKNFCIDNKIPYVDNFLTFFNRPELFKKDRLHPNLTGSHLLSENIQLTIEAS